ncbi:MAG: glycosyltransferase [Lachnospiraceae bacterium]|nr:glycosyltransferase [Lachnospiraceae bacterium]
MKFSIIVVALNAGEKLKETVDSVLNQTWQDYEIVVKDGGSKDGSVDALPEDERIKVYVEKDTGIYEAMNQAVAKAKGDYILFLNCGDNFYDDKVLERAAACIEKEQGEAPLVVYGDTYGAKNDVMIAAPKKMDGFACYRNIPCHQSCFYASKLCKEKPYLPEYRIRADYEHFLWCFYEAKAKMVHMGSVVASYEGGGYSESKENRKRDKEEHKLITEKYMDSAELAGYRRAMMLSMAPLRSFLAENKLTSWAYHWLKDCLYHHRLRMVVGLVVLVVELALFFGSDVMLEDAVSYHTGEGSWEEQFTEEAPGITQEFVPQYDNLAKISFLMHKEHMTQKDGVVNVVIADADNNVVFQGEKSVSKVRDGRFTDMEVNLTVDAGKKYYLTLMCSPSSAGEFPTVGVCNFDITLPENGALVHADEIPGVQLVSRYNYEDILPASKARNIIIICVVTALGIMLGLPDNKYIRMLAGLALMAVGPYMLGSRLELLTFKETIYLPFALDWNVGLMYAIEILVLLCTHSPRVTIAVTNLFLTFLYSVNYFVIMYRGTPLRPNDVTAIGTATQVAGDYSFVPNNHLAMAWGLCAMIVVFGVQTGAGKIQRAKLKEKRLPAKESVAVPLWKRLAKPVSYVVTIAIAVAAAVYGGHQLINTELLHEAGFKDEEFRGFNQDVIYYANGYLVATCIELKNAKIEPPVGYTVEYVEGILSAAEHSDAADETQEELPHVILVMNESFADLRVLGNVELSQENMAFFNSLKENTIRGYVNASVLGGGTANTEFEVFTGCNMAFFSANYYPYQQAIKKPVNSLVSQMEKNGYTTYSMHPEPSGNWNRGNVYRHYGFDKSLFQRDFEGAEEIHSGVSDAETFNKIIELYENRQADEKMFIFDLTMQNHGNYNQKNIEYDVFASNWDLPQVDEYLSCIKISDEAFADLVSYFEKQDEKVIICMYGDHQPWISDLLVETDKTDSNVSVEDLMLKYKTPFVIWANYDIEEAEGYDISMNYLGGLVQRTAGIPLSPYFAYLEKLREEYPIITVNGYVDKDGNYYNWGSAGDEFPDYRMLQYNYLFDDETVDWGY